MLILMQAAVALAALAVVTMWPPVSGSMLLIPVIGRDANATARMALAGRALLIGPGPFAGSMTVKGDRTLIARQNFDWNVIIVAAPSGSCSDDGRSGGAA